MFDFLEALSLPFPSPPLVRSGNYSTNKYVGLATLGPAFSGGTGRQARDAWNAYSPETMVTPKGGVGALAHSGAFQCCPGYLGIPAQDSNQRIRT